MKLCLSCLDAGLRNIYIADPVMIHDEFENARPRQHARPYRPLFQRGRLHAPQIYAIFPRRPIL